MVLAAALIGAFAALPGGAVAKRRHHPTRVCAYAGVPANRAPAGRMREAVLCLVNKERGSFGLPQLHPSAKLNSSAQGWTNAMVQGGFFDHGDPGSRISGAGYSWSAEGENIATGYPTPRDVVTGWMHSAGHCSNILSPNYRDLGIGVNGHPVRGYAGGPATWTGDFGLGRGQGAPSGNSGPANSCPH